MQGYRSMLHDDPHEWRGGLPMLARKSIAIDMSEEKVLSSEEWDAVHAVIDRYKGKPGSLIPVLEEIQEKIGYLPEAVQSKVALGLKIPCSEVYGVVTFYSYFTMVPRGKHTIRCCLGTACYVRGGKRNLEKLIESLHISPGETTEDREFSLETVRCLGACGLAPVLTVDEETIGQVKPSKIPEMLESFTE
jgi:NADH-quinone oxidoreductase subunit E/NADP-reducing hydrogenase subunit HndA